MSILSFLCQIDLESPKREAQRFFSPGLSAPNDLLKLLTGHDAVVVAFVDLERHQKAFQIFFQTSVKFLERDPVRDMLFAVVTGDSAKAFGVDTVPSVRLYQWNETLVSIKKDY